MNAIERGAARRKVMMVRIDTRRRVAAKSDCLHCHGTGHPGGDMSDPNECGFCE